MRHRRLKSEVLDQLPDKQRTVILLDPTLVQRQDRQAEHLSQMVNDSQLRYFTMRELFPGQKLPSSSRSGLVV